MNSKSSSSEKFRSLVEAAIQTVPPLKLYDLEYQTGSALLRLFIINPETLTAEMPDCVRVDHALTEPLQADWIPEGITLEVSSPGIYRSLRTPWHFEMSVGRRIKLRVREPVIALNGKKDGKFFELMGYVKEFQGEAITLEIVEPALDSLKGHVISVPLENIQVANWEPVLDHQENILK
ncbi:MAG: hypothetical protein QE271_05415 [Bacteriovoracaceae bacterium]|nr:hypothetical protein [Bacteriovoracaceae bacterium]